jgi:hypothetical protein
MPKRKKSGAAKRPSRAKKAAPQQREVVEAYDNQWVGCLPLSEAEFSATEKELGLSIRRELRALFLRCNGGRPKKSYYESSRIMVQLGRVLPVQRPDTPRREWLGSVVERAARYGLPKSTIPFGFDNGEAGVFCVDAKTGRVVYWVHDEPEDPIKDVAASLDEFLSSLVEPPY